MAVVLPHTFTNGTNADAAQVDENFAALVAALEAVGAAASGTDVYQAGVVKSTDWRSGLPPTIIGGTGVVTLTLEGGAAWLPNVGGLTRTFQEVHTYTALVPPVLPGPSGFIAVGVELTAASAGAVLSLVSGAEQTTEALALANPPAVSNGKIRLRDLIVENTAGTYSIVKDRDRRPWARGASALIKRTSGPILLAGGVAALDATNLALRIECAGVPITLGLVGNVSVNEGATGANSANLGFRSDGAAVDGTTDGAIAKLGESKLAAETGTLIDAFHLSYTYVPVAGSHLFQPTGFKETVEAAIEASAGRPLLFYVREDIRPSASNGTA